MRATRFSVPGLALLLLLAGCVTPEVPSSRPEPGPPAYSVAGLETVMGRTAHALEAQFGKPRFNVEEGDARKLQFAGSQCILDAYLYPPARGGDPVVTYVDSRLPDGRDTDRASCVAALIRREEAR